MKTILSVLLLFATAGAHAEETRLNPDSSFEAAYQASVKEAVRLFPDLEVEGSKLRKAVEEEIQYLAEANSPFLKQPIFPLAVASRLADIRGIKATDEGTATTRRRIEAAQKADQAFKLAKAESEYQTSYDVAVLEAERLYPDLAIEGSLIRKEVEKEIAELARTKDPLLSNPNFPIKVAEGVARSLKILSSDQIHIASVQAQQTEEARAEGRRREAEAAYEAAALQQAQAEAYRKEREALLPEGDRKALERRRQDELNRRGPMAQFHEQRMASVQSTSSQQQPSYIILPPRGPVRPGTVLRDSSGRVANTLEPGRVYHKRAVDDAEEAQILRLSQAMERGASQEELAMMATTEELQQLRTEIERLRQDIPFRGRYRYH